MIIDKQLCKLAAIASLNVYRDNINYGKGVEAKLSCAKHHGELIAILAFAGTNDKLTINPKTWVTPWWDWIRNLDVRSINGLKRSSAIAARRVHKQLTVGGTGLKVVITGHSLGGSRAIAYHNQFYSDTAIAFNPPPTIECGLGVIKNNMVIFRDPDDPVDTAGKYWFQHPVCKAVSRKDNCIGKSVSEHKMGLWLPYIDEMEDFQL